jgi:hypothetical protein
MSVVYYDFYFGVGVGVILLWVLHVPRPWTNILSNLTLVYYDFLLWDGVCFSTMYMCVCVRMCVECVTFTTAF